MKIGYHAFTDNRDGFFATLYEAIKCVRNWNREGFYNIRIYKEIEQYDKEINPVEDCILSYGAFPL